MILKETLREVGNDKGNCVFIYFEKGSKK